MCRRNFDHKRTSTIVHTFGSFQPFVGRSYFSSWLPWRILPQMNGRLSSGLILEFCLSWCWSGTQSIFCMCMVHVRNGDRTTDTTGSPMMHAPLNQSYLGYCLCKAVVMSLVSISIVMMMMLWWMRGEEGRSPTTDDAKNKEQQLFGIFSRASSMTNDWPMTDIILVRPLLPLPPLSSNLK